MSGTLVFGEEFDTFNAYSRTDRWRTSYEWGPDVPINGETGYYVDTENAGRSGPAGATNPFSTANGVLTITARPQAGLPNGQTYASGVISTMDSFERTYGYFEVRAQMPGGNGFWPAFWLMRADHVWPPELDVMEYASRLPNEYATALHWTSPTDGGYAYTGRTNGGLPSLSGGFHTYGVDWQKDALTWYFDGKAVYSAPTPADMHGPMYMLLNQAVGGGSWIGPPDGSTQAYSIDYVRVYDSRPVSTPQPPICDVGIVVSAHGTPYNGIKPHFNLLVDGVKIGEGRADATTADFAFTAALAAGTTHKVQVQYDNDSGPRDLYVDSIAINGRSFAATDAVMTYDKGALDGRDVVAGQSGLWWNGTLVATLPDSVFPSAPPPPSAGPSSIVVSASGSAAAGVFAHFKLLIDGAAVGEATTAAEARDFVFTPTVALAQGHKVQVQFDNDAYINGQDRNLFVHKVTIGDRIVLPSDPTVVYDKGALDGRDVVAGKSEMWWSGTLVVNADESYFPVSPSGAAYQHEFEVGHDVANWGMS